MARPPSELALFFSAERGHTCPNLTLSSETGTGLRQHVAADTNVRAPLNRHAPLKQRAGEGRPFTLIFLACAGLCCLLLPGCGFNASIYGLRPVSPPARLGGMFNGQLVYPEVDFMRPTFEWQPFVSPKALFPGCSGLTNIAYDLRIWNVRNDSPAELAYEARSLPASRHQLPHPLEPDTCYFWSVRARFQINGEDRLTDWSRSLQPHNPSQRADLPSPIPAPNYFRFVTSGY